MAQEIYLKLDAVIGECRETYHKNWIVLDSFSCSVTSADGDDDFYSGACKHSPLEITKHIDRSSPKLALAACQRTRFGQAIIHICQATASGFSSSIVLRCVLTGVTCISYSLSGEDHSTDSLSFEYHTIEWHYTYIDSSTLTGKGKLMARWDTKSNKGG